MEVVDEDQVAEPVEVGQALLEARVELDPARHPDRRRRLDGHALRLAQTASGSARSVGR